MRTFITDYKSVFECLGHYNFEEFIDEFVWDEENYNFFYDYAIAFGCKYERYMKNNKFKDFTDYKFKDFTDHKYKKLEYLEDVKELLEYYDSKSIMITKILCDCKSMIYLINIAENWIIQQEPVFK